MPTDTESPDLGEINYFYSTWTSVCDEIRDLVTQRHNEVIPDLMLDQFDVFVAQISDHLTKVRSLLVAAAKHSPARATMLVAATGMDSCLGKIRDMVTLEEARDKYDEVLAQLDSALALLT